MSTLFRALVWRHLKQNVLRSTVTLVAVCLGVAISFAIDLANATAVESFARNVNVVSNHVNLQVLGMGHGFDERALLPTRRLPGVTAANPVIEGSLVIGARTGNPESGETLHVLGVDVLGSLPAGLTQSNELIDPDGMINGRGIMLSARVARTYRLRSGRTIRAFAGTRSVALRVAGIIPQGAVGIDTSVAIVDIATAQELFGKLGRLDRIDIVTNPADLPVLKSALRKLLPADSRVVEPAVRTGEIRRMLRSFQLNLAALAYIGLVVGMYLIYNAVAISVVQRRPEIGTVRALGASRFAIFRIFIAEGALFGIAGSLLGLLLGAILAQSAVQAVSRTVDTLYVASHVDGVSYHAMVVLRSFLIGCGLAIVSAFLPAWEAASVLPAASMRRSSERPIRDFSRRTMIAGVIVFILAYAASLLPPLDDQPVFGYFSGLCIIVGASLFIPILVTCLTAAARRLFRHAGAPLQLAISSVRESQRRFSVAIASLMIAVAMMVSIATLVGSFRTTVEAWADDTLTADLFIKPPGIQDASSAARFDDAIVRRIAGTTGVAAVDIFRGFSIPFQGRITNLGAADFQALATRNKVRFIGGVDRRALAARVMNSNRVIVSEPFSRRFGLHRNDRFILPTPTGLVRFKISAVYNDYSSDAGSFIMDIRTFRRLYHDYSYDSIAVYAQPTVDLPVLRSRIIRAVSPALIDVQTNRELRSLVIEIFNRTFAITYALYIISIAIAVLGVVSTLFALVLEKREEIGILRYLGLSRSGVRRMVYGQAFFTGFTGAWTGVVVGILLALLLIYVINRQAFGWLIELHLPYGFFVESLILILAAALLAGIYPAQVASRVRTTETLRSE
ncbi:MAG: FtsX-like permease family protein [Candidatus Eremiobacteraeota bacterium]|nr:FtsX-like permease family protein [Candidatus Eremiobacteraeota bacterium]